MTRANSISSLKISRGPIQTSLPNSINKIQDEMLVLIFENVMHFKSWERHKNWYRATHVCRRWRNIACENKSLWAHIDFSSRGGLLRFQLNLIRSIKSTLPLLVKYDGADIGFVANSRALEFGLLSQQIVGFYCDIRDYEDWGVCMQIIKHSRPKILSINHLPREASFSIPADFLPNLSRLSTLRVDGFNFSLGPKSLSQLKDLTELELFANFDMDDPFNINDVLKILDNCGNLQILYVAKVINCDRSTKKVALPFLQHLAIDLCYSSFANFRESLILPIIDDPTTAGYEIVIKDSENGCFRNLLSVYAEMAILSSTGDILNLTNAIPATEMSTDSDRILALLAHLVSPCFKNTLLLTSLTIVHTAIGAEVGCWEYVYNNLPRLTNISLAWNTESRYPSSNSSGALFDSGMLRGLIKRSKSPGSTKEESEEVDSDPNIEDTDTIKGINCPELTCLEFYDLDFHGSNFVSTLVRTLEIRSQFSSRLTQLKFIRCSKIKKKTKVILRELVEELVIVK